MRIQLPSFLKRYVFIWSLSLILPSLSLQAVTFPLTWRWSNPGPHGNHIIDIAHKNSLYIQVTERGQIYTSTDLASWIPRQSGTTKSLRSVLFFGDRIVISGESGTILYADSTSDFRLVDLGTSDWLEALAASPTLIVAVGDNGAVYSSNTGVSWTRQNVSFNEWLRSVAYGLPSGAGLFVTVGETGTIATSADGMQWTKHHAFTTEDLNKVQWIHNQFVAVGNSGKVFVSSNGTSWQPLSTGALNSLNALTGKPGEKLITGEEELRIQNADQPWSNELDSTMPYPPPAWTYLSAIWDGASYLLGGRTGMLVEGVQTNSSSPVIWYPYEDSPREWLWDTKRMPNLYLAVGDRATLLTSLDGITWEQELPPDSATSSIFLGIGGSTNKAVAVGNQGTIIWSEDKQQSLIVTNADGTITTKQVSTLGIVWTAVQPRPTTNDLQGVAASSSLFVVTGAQGTILTSPDAIQWTQQFSPTTSFLSSVEAFPGGFVAVGANGTILTSPNGTTWIQQPTLTTNWIYRVRYLGEKLVAVGQNGIILTSNDGISWAKRESGTQRLLTDVEYIDGTYFIVGTHGTVLTSPDALAWTDRGTITSQSLYSVATHNGQLVAAGVEGIILRSQVVPVSTPVQILQFPYTPTQNLFLFAGQTDQRFTLDRSTNLQDWSQGQQLEIFSSSGTLLYLDNGSNASQMQFFRAKPLP